MIFVTITLLLLVFSQLLMVIGISLSDPLISEKNFASIAFTKMYVEIWINDTSVMHSQKLMFKNQVKN